MTYTLQKYFDRRYSAGSFMNLQSYRYDNNTFFKVKQILSGEGVLSLFDPSTVKLPLPDEDKVSLYQTLKSVVENKPSDTIYQLVDYVSYRTTPDGEEVIYNPAIEVYNSGLEMLQSITLFYDICKVYRNQNSILLSTCNINPEGTNVYRSSEYKHFRSSTIWGTRKKVLSAVQEWLNTEQSSFPNS